jgi:hypothetical protein
MQPKSFILTAVLLTTPFSIWAGKVPLQSDCKAAGSIPSDDEIGERITETELQRVANLRDYSVVRKYRLHNSHLKDDAVMTVRLSYIKGSGKTFEVIGLQNAEGMSRKVLERLVQGEEETSRRKSQDDLAITKANYKFHVIAIVNEYGRRCYVVELTPRHKSKYLIQGKAWVDADEFALVRVEGRPAASLSFWVGKPYIVQDFHKVGPFWMASHNRSESQSFLLGSSVLTIDYSNYQVNPDTRVAEVVGGSAKTATFQ